MKVLRPSQKQNLPQPLSRFKLKQDVKTAEPSSSELPFSPAVRKILAETQIDPATYQAQVRMGVSPRQMCLMLKRQHLVPSKEVPLAPTPSAVSTDSDARSSRRPLSPIRRKIASRLVEAQQTAAILSTFNEVDLTEIMALRKRHQESFVKQNGVKLGFMSFFVKGVVHALRAVPQINSRMEGNELVENHYFDIGVAVGTEKGLVVPVLRDCDTLSFAEIEQSIVEYAKKARSGGITLQDMQGGCFTITNGGIYGSLLSTPIINPPQSGILGMHSIQERPVALMVRWLFVQ